MFHKVGTGIFIWMELCWGLCCSKPPALLTQGIQLLPQSPDLIYCLCNTLGMRKARSSMGRQTHTWAAGGSLLPGSRLQAPGEQAGSPAQPWPSGISQSSTTAPGSDTRLSPGHRWPNIPPEAGTSPPKGFPTRVITQLKSKVFHILPSHLSPGLGSPAPHPHVLC